MDAIEGGMEERLDELGSNRGIGRSEAMLEVFWTSRSDESLQPSIFSVSVGKRGMNHEEHREHEGRGRAE